MKKSRNYQKFSDAAGMTLVELMIAAGVIAIALVLSLGSIVSISETSALSADQVRAASELASLLEELRQLPFNDLLAHDPLPPVGANPTSEVTAVCFDANGVAHDLPYDSSDGPSPGNLPNPLEVQVTVNWRDRMGRDMTMRASSMYLR